MVSLLDAGADAERINPIGQKPLDAAKQHGHMAVVRSLNAAAAGAGAAVEAGSAGLEAAVAEAGAAAAAADEEAEIASTHKAAAEEEARLKVADVAAAAEAAKTLAAARRKAETEAAAATNTDGQEGTAAAAANHDRLTAGTKRGDDGGDEGKSVGKSRRVTPPVGGGGATAIASINDVDVSGSTPLFIAALQGDTAAVRALLAAGADADKASDGGRTPLWIAAVWVRGAAVQVLMAGVYTRPLFGSTSVLSVGQGVNFGLVKRVFRGVYCVFVGVGGYFRGCLDVFCAERAHVEPKS